MSISTKTNDPALTPSLAPERSTAAAPTRVLDLGALSGIWFLGLLALASMWIADIRWVQLLGLNAMFVGLLVGITYTSLPQLALPEDWVGGRTLAATTLLRVAVVLYGFRISVAELQALPLVGIFLVAAAILATAAVGSLLARRMLGTDAVDSASLGAGLALGGLPALLASALLMKENRLSRVNLAALVLLLGGSVVLALFPVLHKTGLFAVLGDGPLAVALAVSNPAISQLIESARFVSEDVILLALAAKDAAILAALPLALTLLLAAAPSPDPSAAPAARRAWRHNWMMLAGFVAAIGINSLVDLPQILIWMVHAVTTFGLTAAVIAYAMASDWREVRQQAKPILMLAALLGGWLLLAGFVAGRILGG